MNISNNKILITGGASGIGLGLTERFIKEGNTVIICGRREEVLRKVADQFSEAVVAKQCDLASADEREKLYEWIAAEHGDTNVLINNAGIQQHMKIADADFYERAQTEIATNIEAPIHLTNLFLKLDSLRTIINVTSGLSFVPYARVPVYSATKAFFHSFTLSLRHTMPDIEVIEIIPPAINTDLGGVGLHDHAPPVGEFVEAIFEQLKAGATEITFGQSAGMANAAPEQIKQIFAGLNAAR